MKPATNSEKKKHLAAAGPDDLDAFIRDMGEKPFRARQIREWITRRKTVSPDSMTNLPAALRQALAERFLCESVTIRETVGSPDGSGKYLLQLADGETVECASIPAEDGRITFCLSSQVGCPVGCVFCASGEHGLVRNLSAGEIVEEFFLLCRTAGRMPDNIVMMGVGEPLLNMTNLLQALDIITDPDGVGLAQRRVTVSTSGWTPGIFQLAEHGRQWNLAVSLHAPDDELRARLIPDPFRKTIREILQACKAHRDATGRIPTFEYVLLAGVNDSPKHARALAEIVLLARAKVNLIPYNHVDENGYTTTDYRTAMSLYNKLMSRNVRCTLRQKHGDDIDAACGQLRSRYERSRNHD